MRNVPILNPRSIRRIKGSFGFVLHRFLNDGFFASLDHDELVLYFFLVLVSDRYGMSWYGDLSIQRHTGLQQDQLETARSRLIDRQLISFESPFVQLLELPDHPVRKPVRMAKSPATAILKSLQGEDE